MAKLAKRTKAARAIFEGKDNVTVEEAVALIKKAASAKFDETVEIAMNLGVDPRHADQMVRGVVQLPNGTGKTVRVAVFARGAKADEAKAAGADIVGAEDLLEIIQGGKIDFDRCIATPDLMPLLGRFGDMDTLLAQAGHPKVDGVVLDIGVSSFQIDQAERGFSFMKDGPLDMRMGASGPSAADVVNLMAERDLANIIFRLGEERNARRIARSIVERRAAQPFETTSDLAALVETAVGGRRGARMHPATQTFQAIRMYVNDELGELARGLAAAEQVLKPGGRLVVVTFHSLEDRLVKQWLRERTGGVPAGSRHLPLAAKGAELRADYKQGAATI